MTLLQQMMSGIAHLHSLDIGTLAFDAVYHIISQAFAIYWHLQCNMPFWLRSVFVLRESIIATSETCFYC